MALPLARGIRYIVTQREKLAAHCVTVCSTVACHNIDVEDIQSSAPHTTCPERRRCLACAR